MLQMANSLPKPDPTFRVFSKSDSTYGVEISIEGTEPTSVTPFATEEAANNWIAGYQKQLAAPPAPRGRRSWAGR
jgi:hypothetical protein